MIEKVVSPGVFTQEIDKTFLPAAVADIGAVVIGPTVKGPALVPTIVTSYSEFQAKFGDSFKSGSNYYQYLTSHTAESYLKHSNKLTVVRVLAGSYGQASATISSSIDPAVVGGGSPHSASLGFPDTYNTITSSLIGVSASIGGVDFKFTGSTADTTNTSTEIWVATGSTNVANADAFRDAINNSSSLHGLPLTASSDTATAAGAYVTMSFTINGAFGAPTYEGAHQRFGASMTASNASDGYHKEFYLARHITASVFNGGGGLTASSDHFEGGHDFGGVSSSFKEVFKLHTLSDGEIMNNAGAFGDNNLLVNGTDENIRWEITSLNQSRGTFTLQLRRGDDVSNRKQVLETYNNISLDPNSSGYIGKAIGDQYYSIATDENSKPFLKLNGNYPQKSKYVRVEVLENTIDYLDENGNIRDGNATASLPAFASGSNSGSYGGSFSGGSDGTVQHPFGSYMYDGISENNSQGLDPSGDGAAKGYNEYIQALDLISNQDEYDVNLVLTPGIINSIHTAVASKVIDVCERRADCFAIIDPVVHGVNVGDATSEANTRSSNYASMYWPWVKIPDSQVAGTHRWVPPSVAVAGIYSFNDKVAHEWFAPAGLNRGTLNTVSQAERNLTISDRDTLYDSNVNPIATFPGQGVTVYGQKTLQKKASSLDRINVRRLLIKLKKFIASSSRFLVFEQNTAATRRRFLGIVNPFLEQVQSQSGLNAFRVVMDETNNTPDTIDRNQLVGQLFLQPTRTAEFIVLDFTIQPTGASFPE